MNLIEIIGWVGAFSLLTAFVLNIYHKIEVHSAIYLILNLAGSLLLLYNAYVNEAYPFVVVNLFWVIFSGIKLVRLFIVGLR